MAPSGDKPDTAPDTDTTDGPHGETGDPDTAADTETDTDTDGETGETDTTAPLAGSFQVEGAWREEPFSVGCTEADDASVFVRYWADAVGNVAGSLGCYRGEDRRSFAAVSFTRATSGEWTAPAEAAWTMGDQAGAWSYQEGSTWALAFTRFERVDIETYALAGTLSATWTDDNGGGSVTGSFDALLPCSGACP